MPLPTHSNMKYFLKGNPQERFWPRDQLHSCGNIRDQGGSQHTIKKSRTFFCFFGRRALASPRVYDAGYGTPTGKIAIPREASGGILLVCPLSRPCFPVPVPMVPNAVGEEKKPKSATPLANDRMAPKSKLADSFPDQWCHQNE